MSNQTAELRNNTIDQYHQKDGYISKSVLSDIIDCPAVFKHWHVDNNVKPQKDHLNIGNAVHTLAIEPELFNQRYHVLPEAIRRDKRSAAYIEQVQIAAERTIITFNDYESIHAMAMALKTDRTAKILLSRTGKIEHSIYWTCPKTGLKFKCRPDQMGDDGVIVDIKTDRDVRPHKFKWQSREYCYDMSVALTYRGYEALYGKPPEEYIFLLVDKEAPHIVQAYNTFRTADDSVRSVLDEGNDRLDKAINKLLECQKTGIWPAYFDGIQPLSVPV
jgi:hypothetical protein